MQSHGTSYFINIVITGAPSVHMREGYSSLIVVFLSFILSVTLLTVDLKDGGLSCLEK